jgi:hypothetical protein
MKRAFQKLAVLCVLFATACGRQSVRVANVSLLPPFPEDRKASYVSSTRLGTETALRSSGAYDGLQSELFLPLPHGNTMEWAVYQFSAVDEDGQLTVNMEATGEAWLALADFSSHSWKLSGPFKQTTSLAVNPAVNLSPNGNLYAAVLVSGLNSCVIQSLDLNQHSTPTPVITATPAYGRFGDKITFDGRQSTADGEIFKYEWDLDGDGVFEKLGDTASLSLPNSHIVPVSLRITDYRGHAASTLLDFAISHPRAEIDGSALGVPGEEVRLSGSSSGEPYPGTIVSYEWDLDGDGTYETNNGSSLITLNLPDPAARALVGLRVTDELGATDEITHPIASTNAVRLSQHMASLAGLQTVAGNPAVVYAESDSTQHGIYYRRALDPNGSAWGDPIKVADMYAPFLPTFAIINGLPAVACTGHGYSDTDVYYVTANDNLGTSWQAPVQVKGETGKSYVTLHRNTLVEVDGRPALVYALWDYSRGGSAIYYSRALDAAGTSWGTGVQLDTATPPDAWSGSYCNLLVLDGYPAVYYGNGKAVHALDQDGTQWGSPQAELRGGGRLAMLDSYPFDVPAAVYSSGPDYYAVSYSRATAPGGVTWLDGTELEPADHQADTFGISVIHGVPWVYSSSQWSIRYRNSYGPLGDNWGPQLYFNDNFDADDDLWVCDDDFVEIPTGAGIAYGSAYGNSCNLWYGTVAQ